MGRNLGTRHITWFLFLTVVWANTVVLGQRIPDPIAFERITVPGTIRSSQVTHIVQDRTGLLWFAGHGLFRYDGYGFKQYRTMDNGQGDLSPYEINTLLYDSAINRLYAGTHRLGILRFDYDRDQLVQMPCTTDAPIINQLAQTADGKIWAMSYQEGIFYIDNDSLKRLADPHKIYQHPSTILAWGSKLLIGGPAKVVVLDDGKPVDEIILSFQGNDFPNHADVTALFVDRDENLWIGTHRQGVVVYNLKERIFTKHFPPTKEPFYSRITAIHQDRNGLFWILTKANGLVVHSVGENRTVHLRKDPFSAKSISTDNCFSILEDQQGIIWIGGTGDLNKFDKNQLKFRHYYHNPLQAISLSDNMVRSVYEDVDGTIWVGTDAGYINVIDPVTQRVEYRKVELPHDDLTFVPVWFLPTDDNTVLVGTYGGLLQWNRRSKTFTPYAPLWTKLRDKVVRQILQKGDTLFYLSSGTLNIYNRKTRELTQIGQAGDEHATNITAIHFDSRGRLWVGNASGVSLYDAATGNFRFIPFPDLPRSSETGFLLVLSIREIGPYLYVGTFNAGLWRIDLRSLDGEVQARNFTVRDGLPSNTIYATLPDSRGRIWMSTNSGIVNFDPSSNTFVTFSVNEGMQEEEFNRLAYATTRSGEIIFGGINGINVFKPEDIELNEGHYHPQILSIRIYNPVTGKEKMVSRVGIDEPIRLTYEENFLDFQFFVPRYSTPRRYSLYYRLDNFENEWKEVTGDNKATFTNIDPGSYKFMLRTVSPGGEENITEIPVVISPPLWKTGWFIVLSFLVVAFLVMTIIRSYIRKGRNDRERLQELLRIRTYEIEKSREELQILNQKKDLIFSILSHDLRSPLTTLKGFLGYLIDHAHELSHSELKRHAINIRNSVTNSLDLIDNTLFWSLSQMGNIQYTPTNFSLCHLLEKLRGLYQLTADKKRIAFHIECAKNLVIHGDENMIYVTLRNIVSNALKFTSEGKSVKITCVPNGRFAHIEVVDEGIGMSEDYVQRILTSDQPMLKKGTSNEKGTGLGLLLCMRFIRMNHGEIDIKSIENQGTTFVVKLPMAGKHVESGVQDTR